MTGIALCNRHWQEHLHHPCDVHFAPARSGTLRSLKPWLSDARGKRWYTDMLYDDFQTTDATASTSAMSVSKAINQFVGDDMRCKTGCVYFT